MLSDSITELHDAFQTEDNQQILTMVERLDTEFTTNRDRSKAAQTITSQISANAEPGSEAATVADKLNRERLQATSSRARIMRTILAYLDEELSGQEAAAQIHPTIERFESFEQNLESVSKLKGDIELPELFVLTAPRELEVPKGQSLDATVTLENVGTKPVDEISLTIEEDAPISVATPTVSLSEADSVQSVSLKSEPTDNLSFTVNAVADEHADSTELRVEVYNKAEYIGMALDQISELLQILKTAKGEQSNGKGGGSKSKKKGKKKKQDDKSGRANGLEKKLEAITKRLIHIFESIQGGSSTKAVNKQLEATINQVEAFSNQVSAQRGKRLKNRQAVRLESDVTGLVQVLQQAQQAEV